MTSSGLEWDYYDYQPEEASSVACVTPWHTFSFTPPNPKTYHNSNAVSDWSMSTHTARSSPTGVAKDTVAMDNRNQEDSVKTILWSKAKSAPRRSEAVAESEQTALHRAAVVGNTDVISALLQEGCALDRQDKDGSTALHEVSWHGFSHSVKLLVKAGANIHAKNKAGNTALHLACQNGHSQSCRLLLLGGSRPDTKNSVGETCLHVAARYNHVTIITILLSALCSVSDKNQAGDTPLHIAASLNHKKTARLLLEAGTDSTALNNAGQTPLDLAREQNSPEVALLLTKAPQVQSFSRGRSVRKRRDKLKEQRRAQSVPRDEMLPTKGSVADDTHSSDRPQCERGDRKNKPRSTTPEPRTKKEKKKKQKVKEKGPPKNTENNNRVQLPSALSEPAPRKDIQRRETNQKKGNKQNGPYLQPPHSYKAYQLYTLYRGKDGKIMQAPINGCRCEPLINKLENQLEATKEEIKSEIQTVQERMNSKLGQLDHKNKLQLKVMDKMTLERISAERTECLHRIDQRAVLEKLEGEKKQASVVNELKNWCMSKIQNIEVRLSGDSKNSKPKSSAFEALIESQTTESDSSSRANGLNGAVSLLPGEDQQHSMAKEGSGKQYFVVQQDSPPDVKQQPLLMEFSAPVSSPPTATSPRVVRPKERTFASPASSWTQTELQETKTPASQPRQVQIKASESFCAGTSSLSPPTERRSRQGEDGGRHPRKHSQGRTDLPKPKPSQARPPELPAPQQERDTLHALEITQYFFEAVATQMEKWYERKIEEARSQCEQKAQQDRAALQERVLGLEEELRILRTNMHKES
ncbi:ankyrin repeat domain-containing protein 6-like isoform X1 [Acipenser oxyrinchus oxyrinchus]|uniref:Ankyrin repeat domain-containing protein 6-like isoform X1 n=1 Tax=Acipenser oxyrinchus oxyrinchus TaxID=40147 RepID=A0AAD8GCY2_ACIOX|nr:ankyrin repeat domain-containing protein 6-like isoform X1 [Acipenser oxyrinchus oxyrinchus]